nr:hypothetical protein [Tanacetum cinerariifolium]
MLGNILEYLRNDVCRCVWVLENFFGTQRTVNVAGLREKVGSPVVQKYGIQCFNCKEYGHFTKECRKPKKYDWLADTDEEVNEQELEAHYSYMAKIQEVPNADSSTDSELVE